MLTLHRVRLLIVEAAMTEVSSQKNTWGVSQCTSNRSSHREMLGKWPNRRKAMPTYVMVLTTMITLMFKRIFVKWMRSSKYDASDYGKWPSSYPFIFFTECLVFIFLFFRAHMLLSGEIGSAAWQFYVLACGDRKRENRKIDAHKPYQLAWANECLGSTWGIQ